MRSLIAIIALLISTTASAASKQEIDAQVRESLGVFQRHSSAGHELSGKAAGVLVFPKVLKAGVGIGGEFGEGALLIDGKTIAYYNIASASIGLQLGAQVRSQIVLFMTADALGKFRKTKGWKAGVDGSVALATLGTGDAIDTETAKKPIIGFIFSNQGLMYNLTFEGSKITQIKN